MGVMSQEDPRRCAIEEDLQEILMVVLNKLSQVQPTTDKHLTILI